MEVTGTTILGRYISKMRLNQFKDYRWKDTEFLQELANARVKETMERQGYSAADIAEALAKGFVSAPPAPPKLEQPEEEETSSSSNFS